LKVIYRSDVRIGVVVGLPVQDTLGADLGVQCFGLAARRPVASFESHRNTGRPNAPAFVGRAHACRRVACVKATVQVAFDDYLYPIVSILGARSRRGVGIGTN